MSSLPSRPERSSVPIRIPRSQRASLLGDLRIALQSLFGAVLQLARSWRRTRRAR